MGADQLIGHAQEALLLAVTLSLPVLAVALVVGVLVSVVQTVTQIQDATLAQLPRLLAVAAALAFTGPWMARHLAAFAVRVFQGG